MTFDWMTFAFLLAFDRPTQVAVVIALALTALAFVATRGRSAWRARKEDTWRAES